MPKVIEHFYVPKVGHPIVDGEEFPFYISSDYPVETTTRVADGVTFVTLTLLAEKVTIGGEAVERMRIVDGDGNVIRETVTEVE